MFRIWTAKNNCVVRTLKKLLLLALALEKPARQILERQACVRGGTAVAVVWWKNSIQKLFAAFILHVLLCKRKSGVHDWPRSSMLVEFKKVLSKFGSSIARLTSCLDILFFPSPPEQCVLHATKLQLWWSTVRLLYWFRLAGDLDWSTRNHHNCLVWIYFFILCVCVLGRGGA